MDYHGGFFDNLADLSDLSQKFHAFPSRRIRKSSHDFVTIKKARQKCIAKKESSDTKNRPYVRGIYIDAEVGYVDFVNHCFRSGNWRHVQRN